MKLANALNRVERAYGVSFGTRDHFQNFVVVHDDTEVSYFSVYAWTDEVPEEAESNEELLTMDLSNLIITFKGAYAYHGPTCKEFIEALKENINF